MFSLPTPAKLARPRSFLEHLERIPNACDNADTIESLKHLLLTQIRATEIALEQAPTLPEAQSNSDP
jgi:hypothetical protein